MGLRISDSYLSRVMVRNLHRSMAQIVRFQEMASSMRRVNGYADDPRAVGAIQRYQTLLAANDQYGRNLTRVRGFVETTDSALLGIVDALTRAREVAMYQSSAMGSPDSNDQAVTDVENILDEVLETLNSTYEGGFIFSGQRTDTTPFLRDGDSVTYQGNDGDLRARIGPHSEIVLNIPGSVFLGADNAIRAGRVDLAPRLTTATSLDELNLGEGWSEGRLLIRDGADRSWNIDLTSADTVADVIARIDTATGGLVTASINADETGLRLEGTGPLIVSEVDEGTTAASLGLLSTSSGNVLVGRDVRAAPTPATPLVEIPALAGKLPLGSIVIQIGDEETTVDFSAATTVGDMQAALSSALPELDLRIEGGTLAIVSGSAASFVVSNADGSTAGTDLGLTGTGSPARLFGVLFDLKSALQAHDKAEIRSSLAEIEAVQQVVLTQTIRVGGKENVLDWVDDHLRERELRLQENLSRQRDADVAWVASELSRAETAYEATLTVTSRLLDINLMQYLR